MILQLVGKRYPLKPVRTLKGERRGGGGGEEKEKEENTHVFCEHTHAHTLFTVSGIFIPWMMMWGLVSSDVGLSYWSFLAKRQYLQCLPFEFLG